MSEDRSPDWDIIHSYSRADALADGALIEIPAALASRCRFKAPVAITRAIYLGIIWDHTAATTKDSDTSRDFTPLEEKRLHSLLSTAVYELSMAKFTGRLSSEADRITFTYLGQKVILHIGPGDSGEPVFTLMTREDV
jgi:hypothetical protein